MKMKGRAYLIEKYPEDIVQGGDKVKRAYDKAGISKDSKRDIALYKLSPALVWDRERIDYIVISAVKMSFRIKKHVSHQVAETMVFRSNRKGKIEFSDEITTRHGFVPHENILMELGYELDKTVLKPETEKHFGDILREL